MLSKHYARTPAMVKIHKLLASAATLSTSSLSSSTSIVKEEPIIEEL
jgi:hypothetical protein